MDERYETRKRTSTARFTTRVFVAVVNTRVQHDLRGEEKSIRPYRLRIQIDWLWGRVRRDYVFHGVVLLVDGAKE